MFRRNHGQGVTVRAHGIIGERSPFPRLHPDGAATRAGREEQTADGCMSENYSNGFHLMEAAFSLSSDAMCARSSFSVEEP